MNPQIQNISVLRGLNVVSQRQIPFVQSQNIELRNQNNYINDNSNSNDNNNNNEMVNFHSNNINQIKIDRHDSANQSLVDDAAAPQLEVSLKIDSIAN